uniref:Uncharacterized protein n=1 Tax=virus sp. ctCsQ3 TaxID=2826794 RepID=A0A8S5R680_9VIRU|nr:MAG TPA: hypothetical protein [virus sp. ctCsQ3]
MVNNPYQTTPMMNNGYVPQYGTYQYNPMANIQRFQPQEQIQPQIQQPMSQQVVGINGRMVQAVENINANEVPMDGSMAFFPKQDMSEIYVKGWNADGTIRTIVYKPYTAPKDNQTVNSMANAENAKFTLSDESTELFLNKFNELSEKIGQLEDRFDKSLGTQRKTSRTQSKGGDEE